MFVFECNTHKKDCLVMFLGQYVDSASKSLTSSIQDAYKENLKPELVFFIYPSYLESEISIFLEKENTKIDLTRQKYSPVLCISFDIKGEFVEKRRFDESNHIDFDINYKQLAVDTVKYGYANLMEKRSNDVLVKSPAGTTFVKPSGKNLEEFIYASQLARCNFEHQFLAMSLLRYAPELNFIDCIYIDTSSISPIAESVIYYISKFQDSKCKHITYRSFSSYSGLEKNNKPDNASGSWVIVSASASTSMGKKIVKDWNIKPQQIVTILSYSPVLSEEEPNIGNAVVFCLNDYSSRDKDSFSPIKVQVQGESFSAEVSNPEKALLLKKHKPDFIDTCVFKYHNDNVFSVNKCGHSLHVDYINLRKKYLDQNNNGGELFNWMKQVVQWTIPRNLSAIVVGSGNAEKKFLDDFKKVLSECDFDTSTLYELSPEDQNGMQKIGTGAVLVLSSAVSTGRFFVDVNRELRLAKQNGMRVFATSFVVSPSRIQYKNIQTSLTQGTNGFKYSYLNFNKIFIGSKNLSPWTKELEFIKKLINNSDEGDIGMDFWVSRKEILEKEGEGLNGRVGIHYSDANGKLEIAPDFVFWPPKYAVSNINLEAIYATISSVLQNLRDNEIDGCRLSANIYQHCVIDPENFVRFNDSVLQSCLWRCAMPGELDYRRSDALSSDMQRILRKIFMSCQSARGVISLDLLMGLATRWIKISNEAMNKVIEDAELYLKEPHAILLIKQMKIEFKN